MKLVIQRVKYSKLLIDHKVYSEISTGLLVFLGIEINDNLDDLNWLVQKLTNLRIFPDSDDKMNLSVMDIKGEIMVVSQFTLYASTKKGNRPSFIKAAPPAIAIPLYDRFITDLSSKTNLAVKTGKFGSMMNIQLENDGPVTIIIDSKNRA